MLNFTRSRTYTSPYLGVCLLRYDDDVDGRLCRFDVQGTDMQFDQITSWEWKKVICIQTHFTCGGETLITKTINYIAHLKQVATAKLLWFRTPANIFLH